MTKGPDTLRATRKVSAWVSRLVRWWNSTLPGHAWARSQHLDLGTYTLALAAQQLLSTVPTLIAASAIMTRLHLGSAVELINDALGLNKLSAKVVTVLLAEHRTPGFGNLVLGFVLSFVFMIGVGATTQRILELVWSRPRATWRQWWAQIVWAVSTIPILVGGILISHASRKWPISGALEVTVETATFGLCAGLFYWWTQWILLLGKIRWRSLLPGMVVIAIGSALLLVGSDLWLAGQIDDEVTDYGLIGAAFVLSIWILIESGVVVAGAISSAVVHERRKRRRPEPAR